MKQRRTFGRRARLRYRSAFNRVHSLLATSRPGPRTSIICSWRISAMASAAGNLL